MHINKLHRVANGIVACSIAGAALLATPAQAQDGDEFTGFRIEGILGWDNEGVDFDYLKQRLRAFSTSRPLA